MIKIQAGRMILPGDLDAPDGDYYTMQEFAIINGVTDEAVRVWKRRGQIDTVEINGKPYIPAQSPIRRKYKSHFS